MYKRSVLFFLSLLLLACSGGGPGGSDGEGPAPNATEPDPMEDVLDPVVDIDPPVEQEGSCSDSLDVDSVILSNGFGFNLANTRNQASSINSGNVSSLVGKYSYIKEGETEKRGAPAVTNQAVFFTAGNQLIAIDRSSGCRYWLYEDADSEERFSSASILLVKNLRNEPEPIIFVGDAKGFIYAVYASNGELKWKSFVGIPGSIESEQNHTIQGGIQYYAGQLIVPVSSKEGMPNLQDLEAPCCITHGLLVALDASTGVRNWTFNTTEDAATVNDTYRIGPNGVSVTSTPAIDPVRNAIYISTGQNFTEPVTPYSDSILSIDMTTGLVNWAFQARNNDNWNGSCDYPDEMIDIDGAGFLWNLYDRCPDPEGPNLGFVASPVLVDNGNIVIAGDKGGNVYSLNAENGTINWTRKISAGASLGGIHWGMAVDEDTIYVAATDLAINKASSVNDAVEDRMSLAADASPGIYALDLSTGGLVWETRPTHIYNGIVTPSLYSASLSVTNDVLFAGSLDGVVKAFSTFSGAELWSVDTAAAVTDVNGVEGSGGTIDSVGVVIGRDTLFINSGYSTFGGENRFQAGPGNALFVLALPQD